MDNDQHTTGDGDEQAFGWQEVRATAAGPRLAALLDSEDLAGLDDAALVDAATAARRLANLYEARQLAVIDELRRRRHATPQAEREYEVKADTQAVLELAPALGQSRQRVRSRMHLARSLQTRLPRVWGLLRAGRIDEYAAGEIDGELARVVDPEQVPGVEARLMERIVPRGDEGEVGLVARPVAQVRTAARKLVAQAEPDRADQRFREGFAARRVAFTPLMDGIGELALTHSAAETEAVSHRLSLLARQADATDARSMDQRRADIAIDLLLGRATCTTPTSGLETGEPAADPPPDQHDDGGGGAITVPPAAQPVGLVYQPGTGIGAQINVTVPIQTLMGVSDMPGELLGGEPVPASLARRIAADPTSTWYRMLTDPAGGLLDLSTKAYRASPLLVRALVVRDRTCIGAGCTASAQTAQTDHTREAAKGGRTSYANTGRACDAHNRWRNTDGVELSQPEPGVFCWRHPTGHTYATTPEPQPIASWPEHWDEPASATQLQTALALHGRHEQQLLRDQLRERRRQHDEDRLAHWYAVTPDDRDRRLEEEDSHHQSMDADTLDLVGALLD